MCIALNVECWTETKDVRGFGGTSYNFTTLDECQLSCIGNDECVAIDWEPSNVGKTCWILKSTFTRETEDPGVITHYEIRRPCLS